MATETASECKNHPYAMAVGTCARAQCAGRFCEECRTESSDDRLYCSVACRDGDEDMGSAALDAAVRAGSSHPFRTGWRLWLRSIPILAATTSPVALAMALVAWSGGSTSFENLPREQSLIVMLLGLYGVALSGVTLSRQHAGLPVGSPYLWALKRVIPYATTWLMVAVTTTLGLLLFIIPGMIVAIRLVWADEFALVHASSPARALQESWEFTRGRAMRVFGFQWLVGFASYLTAVPVIGLSLALSNAIQSLGGPIANATAFGVSALMGFLAYGSIHGPELAYFYGIRADDQRLGKPLFAAGELELSPTFLRYERTRVIHYTDIKHIRSEPGKGLLLTLSDDSNAIIRLNSMSEDERTKAHEHLARLAPDRGL